MRAAGRLGDRPGPNNDLARLGDGWPEPPGSWRSGDAVRAAEYLADTEVVVWTPRREAGRAVEHYARRGGRDVPGLIHLLADLSDGVSGLDGADRIAAGLAQTLTASMDNDPGTPRLTAGEFYVAVEGEPPQKVETRCVSPTTRGRR
jgi:hypothetical protein